MPSTSKRKICPILYVGYIMNPNEVEAVAYCFKDKCGMKDLCRALPALVEELAVMAAL